MAALLLLTPFTLVLLAVVGLPAELELVATLVALAVAAVFEALPLLALELELEFELELEDAPDAAVWVPVAATTAVLESGS